MMMTLVGEFLAKWFEKTIIGSKFWQKEKPL